MKKVLLVVLEDRMQDEISSYLQSNQYICKKVEGFKAALKAIKEELFDVIIVDCKFVEVYGWGLCQEINTTTSSSVLALFEHKPQDDLTTRLLGEVDDFIVQPFCKEELLIRMEALLRKKAWKHRLEINGLIWDEARYEMSYKDKQIKLTPKEFTMIGYLMRHPNQVFARDTLIQLIWGLDSDTEGRTIDSHVRNIREKVRQSGFPIDDYYQTVWGVGYKWVNASIS
ncbi:DNA-binding response regulator, OmpR family, contains REC and winged-helix (wHTH) domain [Oceanobacillus limi]|uniref:DNA-binding response regulator, OmpR family, contains REC and winged-helix (WHTH) domain n=1 Tax=Oceanobacillus limi TaxID=930131 RepID=A0A1I0B9L0_9BACI|nr:response regulator transcription factor [Oceanobacillus limi]SET03482.1 DNA-binding response regulator, OmpR family, contains REC and winged-helix (wHTH) domain [Oceanobacillus limi]